MVREASNADHTRMTNILANVAYKNWNLHIIQDEARGGSTYIQWHWHSPWVRTLGAYKCAGRKWYLSPYMTESELVQTALKAALTAEEHETRESFTYYGKRVYNPHISVRALMEVCDNADVRT